MKPEAYPYSKEPILLLAKNSMTIHTEFQPNSVSAVSEAARNDFMETKDKCFREQFERLRVSMLANQRLRVGSNQTEIDESNALPEFLEQAEVNEKFVNWVGPRCNMPSRIQPAGK